MTPAANKTDCSVSLVRTESFVNTFIGRHADFFFTGIKNLPGLKTGEIEGVVLEITR
jgi:hypothetical protein